MARVAKPAARSSSKTRVMPILVRVESCGQDSGGRGRAPTPAFLRDGARRLAPLNHVRSLHRAAEFFLLPDRRRRACAATGARATDASRRVHLPRGG